MPALLALLVPLITQLVSIVQNAIANAQKSGELTAAEAQAHRDKIKAVFDADYAQPRPPAT